MDKPWYKSAGKVGAFTVLGASIVLVGVSVYKGNMTVESGIQILMGVGAGLGLYGIRRKMG